MKKDNNEIEHFEDLTTRDERMGIESLDMFDTVEKSLGLLIVILFVALVFSIVINAIK